MAAENATKVVELMEVEAVLGKVRCTIFVHVVRGKVATVCYVAGSSFAFVSAGRWRVRLCHLEGGAFDWPDGRVTRPSCHSTVASRNAAPFRTLTRLVFLFRLRTNRITRAPICP